MKQSLVDKIKDAAQADSTLLCSRAKVEETLGNDARYLEEVLGISKSDLIRLERKGLALKARYEMARLDKKPVTGTHRTRWIIFDDVLNLKGAL